MALMMTMMKATSPTRPQTQLILDFTLASITMGTSSMVATSFQIRNCMEEYLKTPLASCLYMA